MRQVAPPPAHGALSRTLTKKVLLRDDFVLSDIAPLFLIFSCSGGSHLGLYGLVDWLIEWLLVWLVDRCELIAAVQFSSPSRSRLLKNNLEEVIKVLYGFRGISCEPRVVPVL